jgi:hypothetical protein
MAKYQVAEATLREAVAFKTGGPKSYIATGEGWAGWTAYADNVARELVVTSPGNTTRIRIPFEMVKSYVAGVVAPRELTAETLMSAE